MGENTATHCAAVGSHYTPQQGSVKNERGPESRSIYEFGAIEVSQDFSKINEDSICGDVQEN